MKTLTSSNGHRCIVDDDVYEWACKLRWYGVKGKAKDQIYFQRSQGPRNSKTYYLLHRMVAKTPSGCLTDHIDGNTLNNLRSNLRVASFSENAFNKGATKGRKGFKGVSLNKNKSKWRARIMINYKEKSLGEFESQIEAAIAYNRAAFKYFGRFARLNDIPSGGK